MNLEDQIKEKFELDIISFEKNEDSSDGNVYNIKTANSKYIVKVYSDFNHVKSMVDLHTYLNENGLIVPKIIRTKEDELYLKIEDKYVVIYSFINGKQVKSFWREKHDYDPEMIKLIAKEIRKLHDVTSEKDFGLSTIEFANNLKRKSIIHFDLTRDNIFVDDESIKFIDFDDAKYGDSVCDIAIVLSFLFTSKTKGLFKELAKIFLDTYYEGLESVRKVEEPFIKEYAKKWVDYLLDGHEFDTSLTESFEFMKNNIENLF